MTNKAENRKAKGKSFGHVMFDTFFSSNILDIMFVAGVVSIYVAGPTVVGSVITVGSVLMFGTDFATRLQESKQVENAPPPKTKEQKAQYEKIQARYDTHIILRMLAYVGFFLSLTILNKFAGPMVAISISSLFLVALVVMILKGPVQAMLPRVRDFLRGRARHQDEQFQLVEDNNPAPIPVRTRQRRSVVLDAPDEAPDAVQAPAAEEINPLQP